MSPKKDQTPATDGRPLFILALIALVMVPFALYAGMILQGKEPAAPDTMAVRPLGAWALATADALGTTPQWVPHLFSGMPSYGSYVYTPASALSPLDYLLKPFAGERGVRYFILMLLGGFAGYAFFRRQGASAPAAAVAALGFVLTPYMPGVIEAGHSTKLRALMHAPLVLLAIDYFLDRPGPLAAAALAVAGAMLGWSNHPQILYYTLMAGTLFGLGRILADRSAWPIARLATTAVWLVIAGAVSFCLFAEPTLAVREYAPHSIRGAGESGGVSWTYATAWSFPPGELPTFLFPEFYGLKGATYFGTLPFTQSTHYVGITFLLAAILGIWRARSKRSWIWLSVSLVFLIIGFGEHFPLFYKPLFQFLPYFSKFRVPSMIYSLLPLALGYLVASGLDAAAAPDRARRSPRGWWIAAGFAAGVAALALVIGLLAKSTGMQDPAFVRPNEAGSMAAAQLDQLRSLRWDMRVTSMVRSLLLVSVLLAAVPFARRLRRPRGAALLGIVVLADLLLINVKFIDLQERSRVEAILEPTPAIEFLQKRPGPFRVFPIEDFGSNRFVAFDLTTVGGYQPAKLRIYQDLLDRQLLSRPPVLSMLNVRYLLSQRDPGLPVFRRVADGIYEYGGAQPRAWFVPSWRALDSEDDVLRALGRPDFDPASLAFFSGERAPDIPNTGLPIREVAVEQLGPHHVRLRAGDSDRAGLLVVSEIYYEPGWSASIDGAAAEILPANHCLRALVVPPGEHEIEMRFASRAFRTGRALNRAGGAAVLLLVLAGVVLLRRGRREVK